VAIQPICLPTAEAPHHDRIFEAAGWGNGSPVLVRKFLNENLPNETLCKNEAFVSKLQICAGGREGGDDSCKGDSGGPLMSTTTQHKTLLAGIISFGPPQCGQKDKASFYTDTRQYLTWIKKKLEKDTIQNVTKYPSFKQFKSQVQNKKKKHWKYNLN